MIRTAELGWARPCSHGFFTGHGQFGCALDAGRDFGNNAFLNINGANQLSEYGKLSCKYSCTDQTRRPPEQERVLTPDRFRAESRGGIFMQAKAAITAR